MTRAEWVWRLVDLAAALAADDERGESEACDRLEAADRHAEVEELLLQTYLFLGFPTALEAFRHWRMRGVPAPPPSSPRAGTSPDATPTAAAPAADEWERRGERVCRIIYGDKYERLRENVAKLHPDLDRWMVAEGYGKVLGRPELSLDVREMCIVAMLVVRGARRQLRSHLQGALNAGVSVEEVERVVERSAPWAPAEHVELAWKLWDGVKARAR